MRWASSRLGSCNFPAVAAKFLELLKALLFVGQAFPQRRTITGTTSGSGGVPSVASKRLHATEDKSIERVCSHWCGSLWWFLAGLRFGWGSVGFGSSLVLGPVLHGAFRKKKNTNGCDQPANMRETWCRMYTLRAALVRPASVSIDPLFLLAEAISSVSTTAKC